MSRDRIVTGREAEDQAVAYLMGKGWTLVARNWRCRHGEIDIIMRDGEVWVFIEVRSRHHSQRYGAAKEAIDTRKQLRVRSTVEWYIMKHQLYDVKLRCDAVAITFMSDGQAPRIEHFRAAF